MKIKNLKITSRAIGLVCAGTIALTSLTGCGNKQILDFNKSFNVAVESNNGYVSVAAIKTYSDYSGDQVQFVTEDGLRVLTSTHQTELMKGTDTDKIYAYALSLAGDDETKVMDYNAMQGVSINTDEDSWNKDIFDLHFTYDKAIILSDETATIVELETWRDYDEDDKIQLKLTDGNCILTNMDHVKLINSDEAKNDSLHNYAASLVGNEDNVIYYESVKEKVKSYK